MLEKVIKLLKDKEVFYDSRLDEFVPKKDPFVAPECYTDIQEIIKDFERFNMKLTRYYMQLKKLK